MKIFYSSMVGGFLLFSLSFHATADVYYQCPTAAEIVITHDGGVNYSYNAFITGTDGTKIPISRTSIGKVTSTGPASRNNVAANGNGVMYCFYNGRYDFALLSHSFFNINNCTLNKQKISSSTWCSGPWKNCRLKCSTS